MRQNDVSCFHSHKLLKSQKSRNQKDFEGKKNDHFSPAHNIIGNKGQSDQALG